MRLVGYLSLSFLLLSFPVLGAHVLSEFENSKCEEFQLSKPVVVFKDPSLFVGSLGEIWNDPHQGWKSLMSESPIVTTLEGSVRLMRLGNASEFKNFGVISKLYELADSRFGAGSEYYQRPNTKLGKSKRPLIIPVKICDSAYSDSLGFVLLSDFQKAQSVEVAPGAMPPSVYPNPIPELK